MTLETPKTIGQLLSVRASRAPDRTFLSLGESRWTYSRAEDQAVRLARTLYDMGLEPGERLAVVLPNVPEFVLATFAAAKLGAILVPIDPRRHPTEILARLLATRPAAIIGATHPAGLGDQDFFVWLDENKSDLPHLRFRISVDEGAVDSLNWRAFFEASPAPPDVHVGGEDPAAIMYTFGGAGRPRGALLAHQALVSNAMLIASNLNCSPDDVFLGAVPFSNTFGLVATIMSCVIAGARLECLPRYSPDEALRVIRDSEITIHHGVPTMFALELNHPDFQVRGYPALRSGIISGAPCPPDLVRRVESEMGMRPILAYGLTEASPSVTMTRLDDGPVTAVETVGRPHPNIALKVIDSEGETLPHGREGELCVRGDNLMLRYWEDPAMTAEVLDDEGWLHTGDLATIDPDGPVRIVGRKDEVVNRGGDKIYPASVEMVLRSFPGVKNAALVGIPDLLYGELTCACIVREADATFSEEELSAYAAAHMADFAIPDRFLFLETLPRRGSGPVLKDYLRERVRIHGRAWKFGKNVDTDAIIPARRCNTSDPSELALYCMEDADPDFVRKMKRGDLIVADTNFGCGSSREVAPLSIKAAGVSAVIAKSFARIFFRNAINIGLPILECPAAVEGIREGDMVEVEPANGIIRNLTTAAVFESEPFPDFLQRIIDRGGLLAYVEGRLAGEGNGETQ